MVHFIEANISQFSTPLRFDYSIVFPRVTPGKRRRVLTLYSSTIWSLYLLLHRKRWHYWPAMVTTAMMTIINKRCGQLGQSNMYRLRAVQQFRTRKTFWQSATTHTFYRSTRKDPFTCVHWTGPTWPFLERQRTCNYLLWLHAAIWPSSTRLSPGKAKTKFKNFTSFTSVTTRMTITHLYDGNKFRIFSCDRIFCWGGGIVQKGSHLWSTKRSIWIFYWKFTAKIRD